MNLQWIDKFIPKKMNTTGLYIILIIGVVILALGSGLYGGKKADHNEINAKDEVIQPAEQIEKQLSQILSEIKGAGDVSVMISYESTSEKIFATDTNIETAQSDEQGDAGKPTKKTSTTKQDIKTITPGNTPVLSKQNYPKVRGVIVVADGAGDAVIKQNIILAVKSVLDIPDHKIGVFIKK